MLKIKLIFSLLFLIALTQLSTASTATENQLNQKPKFIFSPPKDWKKEKKPIEGIEAIYTSKAKTNFSPTINITSEQTKLDIDTYLKKTIEIHCSEPLTTCKEIKPIVTQAGKARLLQIESETNFGKVQFLQAIIFKEQTAFVLTATALKEDFPSYYMQFYKSFKTFSFE